MKLDEKTFGDTPGAMYLARVLNELNSHNLTRSAGKRITATKKQVNDLEYSYLDNTASAKTVANCLRLMRLEISSQLNGRLCSYEKSKERLVEQLISNVQIGYIKKVIRLCSVARKAERKLDRTVYSVEPPGFPGQSQPVYLRDNQMGGFIFIGDISPEGIKYAYRIKSSKIETVTSELLHMRSINRCTRLGKPHVAKQNQS